MFTKTLFHHITFVLYLSITHSSNTLHMYLKINYIYSFNLTLGHLIYISSVFHNSLI